MFILKLCGSIDALTSCSLEEEIESLLASDHRKILLDFADVDHISNEGACLLDEVTHKFKERSGQCALCNVSYSIGEFFKEIDVERVLFIYPSEQRARKALGS